MLHCEELAIDLRNRRISIKRKLYSYLSGFAVIFIIVFWVFHRVYINDFYINNRYASLREAQKKITDIVNSENEFQNQIIKLSQIYDIKVIVADVNGEKIFATEDAHVYVSDGLSIDSIFSMVKKAKHNSLNGNIDLLGQRLTKEEKKYIKEVGYNTDNTLIIADIMKDFNGDELFILLESSIQENSQIINTLNVELTVLGILVLVLSLVLAFIIQKEISTPLVNLSKDANSITNGNYYVRFEGNGYKEIAELADALNNAEMKLREADVLQKEVIANVSHDLRTPLTMISGYAEVMRDIPGENTPENIQAIIDETQRLTDLVNDILDMSKINAGVMEFDIQEYNITTSVKLVIERISKMVGPKGYKVEFLYDRDAYVMADERRMYQVIYNFLGNAINYTGEDKCIFVRQICENDIVRIEVEDTGRGITEVEVDKVWSRYYKKDKSHKRNIIGSGLGLSIAKTILQSHHCNYGVKSGNNKGTVFWFELETTDN